MREIHPPLSLCDISPSRGEIVDSWNRQHFNLTAVSVERQGARSIQSPPLRGRWPAGQRGGKSRPPRGSVTMTNTLKSTAPHIHNATTYGDLADWGNQPDMAEGQSHSSGRLLFKGPNNQPETGIWVCTPGRWRLTIPRDEFCHFVAGRATYVSDDGEVVEVAPGTVVMFPGGWAGECTVHETMRNIYMLA